MRMLEVRCPGCSKVVGHKMGSAPTALVVIGHGRRWYGLIGLLIVKCEECDTVWMPGAAAGPSRATTAEKAALTTGLTALAPFAFYRDIACPACSTPESPKILGRSSMMLAGNLPEGAPTERDMALEIGEHTIPYRHVEMIWRGRTVLARTMIYAGCDQCDGTFDAVLGNNGRIGLYDLADLKQQVAAVAACGPDETSRGETR